MTTLEDAARDVSQRYWSGLLQGILFVLTLILLTAGILALIGIVRALARSARLKRDSRCRLEKQQYLQQIGADAEGRGLCDTYGEVAMYVYFFSSGRRCCVKCFDHNELTNITVGK
jgi:hypothetical protein